MRLFFHRRMLLTICVSLSVCEAFCQSPSGPVIDWGEKVIIHNELLFKDKGLTSEAGNTPGRRHGTFGSQYGRLLRLKNGNWLSAYTVSRNNGYQKEVNGGLQLEIARSEDTCKSWQAIALITDPGRDLDNAEFIRLPNGIILLACRSVRWQESYRLPVYQSGDEGKTWARRSLIDANEGAEGTLGNPDKGVYEPHFYFLKDGRLAVCYASEKHVTDKPSYSQVISQKISLDYGRTWGQEKLVVYQPGDGQSRPGMPVVTAMKNGKYLLVFEVCGTGKCNIYGKVSNNGIDWQVGLGRRIPDQLGGPAIVSLDDGRLIVTSNQSNISVSNDYGLTWQKINKAWDHSVWPAIFQIEPGLIAVVNSVGRASGGHNIQLRFGKVSHYDIPGAE